MDTSLGPQKNRFIFDMTKTNRPGARNVGISPTEDQRLNGRPKNGRKAKLHVINEITLLDYKKRAIPKNKNRLIFNRLECCGYRESETVGTKVP